MITMWSKFCVNKLIRNTTDTAHVLSVKNQLFYLFITNVLILSSVVIKDLRLEDKDFGSEDKDKDLRYKDKDFGSEDKDKDLRYKDKGRLVNWSLRITTLILSK